MNCSKRFRVIVLLALIGGMAGCAAAQVAPAASATRTTAASATAPAKGAAATVTGKPGGTSGKASGKHANLVNGVSCTAAGCVAVGGYYSSAAGPERPLTELGTGETWSLEPAPDGPAYSYLTGVSCAVGTTHGGAAAAQCLAVGDLVLARDTDGRWRLVSNDAGFDAVSCAEPDACVAVGAANKALVYAVWDGTSLRTGTMQAPPHSFQTIGITGVSCVSAVDCVAVGSYSYGAPATGWPTTNARTKTLAEEWDGQSWRLLPTVDVSHDDQLIAISCVSAADCTAVGDNQTQYPFAEHWTGSAWTVEPMPTVSSIGFLDLTGVSCPVAGVCVAAGTYQGEPAAETWNGSAWRAAMLPQPPTDNYSAQLNGISCVSGSECVAVGMDDAADGYAELYSGGGWRLSAMVNPAS